ncbi:unnamed protein product [Symbiodinium sp. CCMP2592]|nr:unnamed protein product [Symbiodinium sp. CCMP2592]
MSRLSQLSLLSLNSLSIDLLLLHQLMVDCRMLVITVAIVSKLWQCSVPRHLRAVVIQVGRPLTYTWLDVPVVSIGYLARFTGFFRLPVGYHLSIERAIPAAAENHIHVRNGEVIVFGFRSAEESEAHSSPSQPDSTYWVTSNDHSLPGHVTVDSCKRNSGPTLQQRLVDVAGDVRGFPSEFDALQDEDDLALPRYQAPAPRVEDPPFEEGGESESGPPAAHFLVLIPDCLPEQITVDLEDGLGLQDVLDIVSDSLDEHRSLLFPLLVPADPQPDPHWGTLLALPPWAVGIPVACFDVREIDGRLFALEVPRQATSDLLCRYAGLDDQGTFSVFAYGSRTPLEPREVAEYVPGGTIVFAISTGRRRRPVTLEHMLARQHHWDPDPELPFGPVGHHHCCVTSGQRLVTWDVARHADLPSAVAEVLHFQPTAFALTSASPAVTDAAISGHHCLNVHAIEVFEFRHERALTFGLLDCRPLLQGWSLIEAPTGRASYSDIVTVLDTFAPAGWISQIDPVGLDDQGTFQVLPGQVFVASYAPDSDQEAVPVEATAGERWTDETQISQSISSWGQWIYTAPDGDEHLFPPQSDPSDDGLDEEARLRTLPFIILAPGYHQRYTWVNLLVPTIPAEAIIAVQQCRSQDDLRRFPVLSAAFQQTLPGVGVLIGEPPWSVHASTICLDVTRVDGRLFAVRGRAYADRHALLYLADLPLSSDVAIFVGGDTHSLPEGAECHLTHGLVVVFVPAGHGPPQCRSLGDMLLRRASWGYRTSDLPTAPDDTYGLLYEGQCIYHQRGSVSPFLYRQHIAACIGVPVDSLRLFPAAPRVSDAIIDGWPVRNVIGIADTSAHFAGTSRCILLDARPIGQGWFEHRVHGEWIDVDELLRDFSRAAPIGWSAAIAGHPATDSRIAVDAGSVLTIEFVATPCARPPRDSRSSSDPPNSASDEQPHPTTVHAAADNATPIRRA